MSQLKLAIDDVAEVLVKFTLKSKGVNKSFATTLMVKRMEVDEDGMSEKTVKEFMHENVIDWRDQRLVLDANDQPAEFSPEALALFLKAPGVLIVCWNAYLLEVNAKAKN